MVLGPHIIATINQRVLSLLAKFADQEFYERQVARRLGISYGSANRSLNDLYSSGAIRRRREGRMCFYSVEASSVALAEFKKLVNVALIEPLVEELKGIAYRVVLYGSCAKGTDTSQSDLDLFIVTNSREDVAGAISRFELPKGYEGLRIQPVVKTPAQLLQAGEFERAFLEEAERGILLWERAASESRV
ncbi:MAG: nucleotidyltransferase domain-containing protein [Chloroflexi bacterium]|nr:nucleotidyltransferase domain-containing protein [Chloroflexota bacterium]